MSEWTAPESGWYEWKPGRYARKLTDEEAGEIAAASAHCDLLSFDTDDEGTHVRSLAGHNVTLPNGQTIPPASRVIVKENG